jgi:ribonuclease P protein component
VTVGRFSFPRGARLCRSSDFTRVYRGGVRLGVSPLRVCALKCADGRSRLGLSISRKVGKANVRNRWKRAIREAFRLNRHRLTAPWDLVVSVDWEAAPDDVAGVEAGLLKAIELLNERAGQEAGG